MAIPSNVTIDLTEAFPHLTKAPIVEAVIEVRARSEVVLQEEAHLKQLQTFLPDYPSKQAQRQINHAFKITSATPEHIMEDLGWNGHACQSSDKKHVAQFNKDGFRFSRMQPYDSWEQFSGEALRLWKIHAQLSQPFEIQRLGLRFINKIMVPVEGLDLDKYLTDSPRGPKDLPLPFAGFMHNHTLLVPGHPFGMQLTQTILPIQTPDDKEVGLVVDIDTFTMHPFEVQIDLIQTYLNQMRWLKNKAFYGSLMPQAIERLK